jgi:hypothetical protein
MCSHRTTNNPFGTCHELTEIAKWMKKKTVSYNQIFMSQTSLCLIILKSTTTRCNVRCCWLLSLNWTQWNQSQFMVVRHPLFTLEARIHSQFYSCPTCLERVAVWQITSLTLPTNVPLLLWAATYQRPLCAQVVTIAISSWVFSSTLTPYLCPE